MKEITNFIAMMDWRSFLIVVLAVAVPVFLRGFLGAAAKDLYTWSKQKIRPPEPEPIKVKSDFRPLDALDGRFAWISEHEVRDKLVEGFTYYLGPEDGARRYQIPNEPQGLRDKAFFMWQPRD